jgi:hypothetical protein
LLRGQDNVVLEFLRHVLRVFGAELLHFLLVGLNQQAGIPKVHQRLLLATNCHEQLREKVRLLLALHVTEVDLAHPGRRAA